MTKKQIQTEIDKLKKSVNVEVLKNRVFNYGQQMLDYKRQKNGEKYSQAKEQRDAAQKELDSYQEKYDKLLNQLKSIDELSGVKEDLTNATKDRDFYVKSGQPVPAEVDRKYKDLKNKADKLGVVVAEPAATEAKAPTIEMPMGAGAPKPAKPTAPVATKTVVSSGPSPVKTPSKTPSKTPTTPTTPVVPATVDDVAKQAVAMGFGAIDSVFKSVPELTTLLTNAVTQKWTPARFQSELQNTNWFKSNASDLQQRGFYKRQYNDLVNAIPAGAEDRQAKIDELGQTTNYGRGLARVKRLIQAEAIAEGAVIEDSALNLLAQDIYDHALENDGLAIRNYVRANIKYQPGKILSGKAGQDLADLKKTAIANGLDLDKAFGSSIQGWLQKLAAGESVDTYKNIIRQSAKVGMPEKIASLLDNGVDLQTIYDPYRNLMASTLEINPETIKLDDPTLRTAITPQSEMSLYDFQKALRKDTRWQYTKQARDEVASAAQKVLQDFGFMG